MNAYLYFCAVCGAVAVGMIFAAAVDFCIENGGHMGWRRKHGKHEIARQPGKRRSERNQYAKTGGAVRNDF
jgi:hypothetical protein